MDVKSGVDSDSGRSPSDDEKAIGQRHVSHDEDLGPDPDEQLTPEERAEIVRTLLFSTFPKSRIVTAFYGKNSS